MYDKSLRTDDITGAQPRSKGAMNRSNQPYNYQQFNQQQNIFSQYDPALSQTNQPQEINYPQNYRPPMNQNNLPQPLKQQQGGRKLFALPQTEIVQSKIFVQPKNTLNPQEESNTQSMYSRSLKTDDIQGTKPGSLASVAVKNQQKAQYISQQNQIQEQQYSFLFLLYTFLKGAYQDNQQQDNYQQGQGYHQQQYPQKYEQNYSAAAPEQYYQSGAAPVQNSQQLQEQYYQNQPQVLLDENMQQKIEEEKQFLQNVENYYRGMTPSINSRKEYNKIQDNLIKAKEQNLKKVDQQIKHDEQIYSSDQFINDISTFYDGEKLIKQQPQKQLPQQEQKYEQQQSQQYQPNAYQENAMPSQYEQSKINQKIPTNQQMELDDLQQKIKMLEQQLSANPSQVQQKQEMSKPNQNTQNKDQDNYNYAPKQRYNPTSLSFAGQNDLIQKNIQATTGNQILYDKFERENNQYSLPQPYQVPEIQKNIHRFGGGLKNMGFM